MSASSSSLFFLGLLERPGFLPRLLLPLFAPFVVAVPLVFGLSFAALFGFLWELLEKLLYMSKGGKNLRHAVGKRLWSWWRWCLLGTEDDLDLSSVSVGHRARTAKGILPSSASDRPLHHRAAWLPVAQMLGC